MMLDDWLMIAKENLLLDVRMMQDLIFGDSSLYDN
jgi:hypothetical protein